MPVFKEWNIIRKTAFGDSMTSMQLEAGEVVYNTGEDVRNVYFLREGLVHLEIFFEVQYNSTTPAAIHLYERKTTTHLVKKVIRVV
jgi:hypothetical protein